VQTAANSGGTATVTTTAGQTISTFSAGSLHVQSATGADLNVTGAADLLHALGLTPATGGAEATATATRTAGTGTLSTILQTGSSLNVDGHVITFKDGVAPAAANVPTGYGVSGSVVTDGNGNSTVYLGSGTTADLLKAIDLATGVQTATNA